MKISTIEVYQDSKPFEIAFHSGQAFRTRSESVILRVGYDNGLFSCGESAPRAYVTGETLSSVTGLIRNVFAPHLLHREIRNLQDVESILNELEVYCRQKTSKSYHSALGAVDIALLDGLGQLEKKPIALYLGAPLLNPAAADSISVPFLSADAIRQLFLRIRHYPLKNLKVLVGGNLSWNVERLAFLRSLFGEDIDLRIEVNGKWEFDQGCLHLKELKKFRISAVEQPLPAHDLEGMRCLKEETGIPVVADESLCTLSDAKRLIESRACDIFNIKVSKCGGLLRSRAIAKLALSAHVPCQLGAHVGETKILTAAGKHFAATTYLSRIEGGYSFLLFGVEGCQELDERLSEPGLGIHSHHWIDVFCQ